MKQNSALKGIVAIAMAVASLAAIAASEITVDIKLDFTDFVVGERVRGVVNVVNLSPDEVRVGYPQSKDRFFVEVFRANNREQLERISDGRFVARFLLKPNEGQKLETFLADHYGLRNPGRYLARPVVVHDGARFEGQLRAFDIVPGMKISGALQMFSNHDGLKREFEMLSWNRNGNTHLFLAAKDVEPSERYWRTTDLGMMMKVTKPTLSLLPTGEVVTFHRVDSDHFVRSEFWSLGNALEFRRRELVQDPETAGSARVREVYNEHRVEPVDRPWWKFW